MRGRGEGGESGEEAQGAEKGGSAHGMDVTFFSVLSPRKEDVDGEDSEAGDGERMDRI